MKMVIGNQEEEEGRDYRILILLFGGLMICLTSLLTIFNFEAPEAPYIFHNLQESNADFPRTATSAAMRPFFFLPVQVNSADLELLQTLPGIGPALGQRIILLRESRKGFHELNELLDVKGIGHKKFAAIRKYCVL